MTKDVLDVMSGCIETLDLQVSFIFQTLEGCESNGELAARRPQEEDAGYLLEQVAIGVTLEDVLLVAVESDVESLDEEAYPIPCTGGEEVLDQLVGQLVAEVDRLRAEDLLEDVLQHPVARDDLLVI